MMLFTVISVTSFNRSDRNLFGYRAFIVHTDSMSATDFNAGDLIFVKEVDCTTLEEGDIITYISQNSQSFGETITHKIRKTTVDAQGKPGFVTYGTTTNVDDETIVTYPYVLGKYQGHAPKLGTFFNFLKTPQGYIVCIFVPFMLLIIYQGINCIKLFRRYKKEQTAEMEEERAKIDAERAENAKMLAELQALKAQLEGKTSETTESEAETEAEEVNEPEAEANVESNEAEAICTSEENNEEATEDAETEEAVEEKKAEETEGEEPVAEEEESEKAEEVVDEKPEDEAEDKKEDKE